VAVLVVLVAVLVAVLVEALLGQLVLVLLYPAKALVSRRPFLLL
jgi:hypothetical protein